MLGNSGSSPESNMALLCLTDASDPNFIKFTIKQDKAKMEILTQEKLKPATVLNFSPPGKTSHFIKLLQILFRFVFFCFFDSLTHSLALEKTEQAKSPKQDKVRKVPKEYETIRSQMNTLPFRRSLSSGASMRSLKETQPALACFQPLRCPVLIGTMSPVTPAPAPSPGLSRFFPGLWLLLSVPQWDYVGLWRGGGGGGGGELGFPG